jgi:hypothetical protein
MGFTQKIKYKEMIYHISRILKALMLCILLLSAVSSLAQGPDDPSTDDPGSDVPVDGGLSLMLAAGAAYGVRRVRCRRDAR